MERDLTSSVKEFKREKTPDGATTESGNIMGDRIYITDSIDPYIIEVYQSDFMQDRGDYRGVIEVHENTPEGYRNVARGFFDTPDDAKDEAVGLQSSRGHIESFISKNPN